MPDHVRMAVCITPNAETDPNTKTHCPRCGWKGTVAEAKVIPDSIVQCPQCVGPCIEGHPPEKKR